MGRPKGVPNTPKRFLLKQLQDMWPGYHPVLEMAKLAHREDVDDATRFAANKEVAKYIEPALKAVEVKHEMDENSLPMRVSIVVKDGTGTSD
jgi:hypothetical protein